MEIKINKEIRSYKETVYFGLTARQLICSLLAVGTAVGLYFALRGVLDRETLGWLCIVGAAPMAAADDPAQTIMGNRQLATVGRLWGNPTEPQAVRFTLSAATLV